MVTTPGFYDGIKISRSLIRRFLAKVANIGGEGCWEWAGAHDSRGYGQLFAGRREWGNRRCSRIAWEIVNGPIPEGFGVLHSCDNPPCCRRAHLFLGTQLDNVHDAITKGRAVVLRGARNGNSKLTDEQVLEIRSGKRRLADYAALFGVAYVTAAKASHSANWKHLPPKGAAR